MRNLIILAVLGLAACATNSIETERVRGTAEAVLDRTEVYLAADQALAPEERGTREGALARLRAQLALPEIYATPELVADVRAIRAWHDVYVEADATLTANRKRGSLLTSDLFVKVFVTAAGQPSEGS